MPAVATARKAIRRFLEVFDGRAWTIVDSAHSGTTQQGAQQPAATENLRETNVELREENPKTSPENLINTLFGAP
jgi:hypothetical protein